MIRNATIDLDAALAQSNREVGGGIDLDEALADSQWEVDQGLKPLREKVASAMGDTSWLNEPQMTERGNLTSGRKAEEVIEAYANIENPVWVRNNTLSPEVREKAEKRIDEWVKANPRWQDQLGAHNRYALGVAENLISSVKQLRNVARGAPGEQIEATFDLGPPRNTLEKMADVGAGVTSFMAELETTKRLPGIRGLRGINQEIAAWEALNLKSGGTPGVGAAQGFTFGLLGTIPAKGVREGLGKLILEGATLAEIEQFSSQHPDQEREAIMFFLPFAMRAVSFAREAPEKAREYLKRGKLSRNDAAELLGVPREQVPNAEGREALMDALRDSVENAERPGADESAEPAPDPNAGRRWEDYSLFEQAQRNRRGGLVPVEEARPPEEAAPRTQEETRISDAPVATAERAAPEAEPAQPVETVEPAANAEPPRPREPGYFDRAALLEGQAGQGELFRPAQRGTPPAPIAPQPRRPAPQPRRNPWSENQARVLDTFTKYRELIEPESEYSTVNEEGMRVEQARNWSGFSFNDTPDGRSAAQDVLNELPPDHPNLRYLRRQVTIRRGVTTGPDGQDIALTAREKAQAIVRAADRSKAGQMRKTAEFVLSHQDQVTAEDIVNVLAWQNKATKARQPYPVDRLRAGDKVDLAKIEYVVDGVDADTGSVTLRPTRGGEAISVRDGDILPIDKGTFRPSTAAFDDPWLPPEGTGTGMAAGEEIPAFSLKRKRGTVGADLARAFPGTTIKPLPERPGWRVEFESGRWLDVHQVESINIDWAAAERQSGRTWTPEERAQAEAAGSFVLKMPDGQRVTALGIMELANRVADAGTVFHEALHLARQTGMFTDREWSALVKKHSDPKKPVIQQEEDVAQARETHGLSRPLRTRVKGWLKKILSGLGLAKSELTAEQVHDLMNTAAFWRREMRLPQRPAPRDVVIRGRPDLANPGGTPGARQMWDAVMEMRNRAGVPGVRPDAEVFAEVERRLTTNRDGERARILQAARTGRQLNDTETVLAQRIFTEDAERALASGDARQLNDAVDLAWSYADTGTEQARAFRQRRDRIENPAQRRRRALMEAVFTPPPSFRMQLKEFADKMGMGGLVAKQSAQSAAELRQHYAEVVYSIRDNLQRMGFDFSAANLASMNNVQAMQHLAAAEAAKNHALHLKPNPQNKRWIEKWNYVPNKDARFELWRNMILSGTQTGTVNFAGNIGYGAYEFLPKRFLGALLNTLAGRAEGAQWGEFSKMGKAVWPGIVDGFRAAVLTWRTERGWWDFERQLSTASTFEAPKVAIRGKTGYWVRSPQRIQEAGDQFARALFFRVGGAAYAYRQAKAERAADIEARMQEILADPTHPVYEKAVDLVNRLTFRGKPGKVAQAALLAREAPGIQYLIPFVRTPEKILTSGLKEGPLGLIPYLTRTIPKARATGDMDAVLNEGAAQIIAWGTAAVLMYQMQKDADNPLVTGSNLGRSRAEKGLNRRIAEPYTFRLPFGKTRYSYARAEPFATAIASGVDFADALLNGEPNKILGQMFRSTVEQAKSKTFLQGLGDFFTAMEADAPEDKIISWASNFASSWIPNLVRQPIRNLRENLPERGVWGKGTEWWERIKRRTFQKAEVLTWLVPDQPMYDVWGNPIKLSNERPQSDFLWRVLVPSRAKDPSPTIGDRVLFRYNDQHPDIPPEGFLPPQKYYRDGKRTRYLTDEEYAEYAKLAGEKAREFVENAHRMKPFDTEKPSAGDVERIKKAVETGREVARNTLMPKWRQSRQ
jgi:hypothetical protein